MRASKNGCEWVGGWCRVRVVRCLRESSSSAHPLPLPSLPLLLFHSPETASPRITTFSSSSVVGPSLKPRPLPVPIPVPIPVDAHAHPSTCKRARGLLDRLERVRQARREHRRHGP
ncbi:hypothetical protein CONPUDRAFT_85319 [Coniophora puteana RWD-64-598 SS2]|uniref:Uncharacterized protein n=1 Tax=Coniophora puteana (strain RWD-64-598) TaxID=741705 RepID=A0A5M3M8X1_CONPW|nr:uncharacterized protein CONPUDRAFT_85319 [Coniophora puteana RWD-64-598 SS2]EIW75527.1 hypothetical protein CONPUDRAFT_85319 [Coniophora puteana RWD-64-598 SS2]